MTAGSAVDGLLPTRRLEPASVAEVAEAIGAARDEGLGVLVWGRGTEIHLGNVPVRYDIALATARLGGVTAEYSPADLVLTVGAGMPWADIQTYLATFGQRIPLDAPSGATAGGVVAAAVSGRRRLAHGTPRDWLVGLQAVTGGGDVVRAGGRVVKNVTGYDLCKLLCGSRGTLAVMTELSFKVAPLPEAVASGTVACRSLADADAVRHAALDARATWCELRVSGGTIAVDIGFEGYAADIESQTGRISAELRREGLRPPEWETARETAQETTEETGAGVTDVTGDVIRVGVLPDRLCALLEAGPHDRVAAHLGTGLARVESGDFAAWRHLASEAGGWAVLEAGAKHDVDVFGDPRPAWAIGQELKRVFDPSAILAPGRGPGRV